MKHAKEVSNEKTSPLKNLMLASPTLKTCSPCETFPLNDKDELKHCTNKENQDIVHVDFDNEFSLQEDSGYLSLHNSQIEHEDHEFGVAEHCGNLQEGKCHDQLSLAADLPCEVSQSHPRLPQLQFQRAVCRYLAQNNKTHKIDLTAIHMLAKDFGLQYVIGGKMGLEYFDILQSLWEKDMKHILTKILCLLGDMDLINCKKVSRSWRKVILQDNHAFERCQAAEQRISESRRTVQLSTRDLAVSRSVLSCIQGLADSPVQKSSKRKDCKQSRNCTRQTRTKEFQEVASMLKQHEHLKSCKRCGFPAKCNPDTCRATCTRVSCGFEFCTRCLGEYHGSSGCSFEAMGSTSRSRGSPVIGSSRSKRNVRRL